jgi:hypothetical protein
VICPSRQCVAVFAIDRRQIDQVNPEPASSNAIDPTLSRALQAELNFLNRNFNGTGAISSYIDR